MSEVLQANIFFVITSIAVVVLTILLCLVLYYVLCIMRNVRDITERIRRGSEQLAEDAQAMREFVHEGIIGTVRNLFKSEKRRAPTHRKAKTLSEESDEQ